jgi:ABC-type multidrug transport system fused ATPase/permease subunit
MPKTGLATEAPAEPSTESEAIGRLPHEPARLELPKNAPPSAVAKAVAELPHEPAGPGLPEEKISVRKLNFYYEDGNRALIDISMPIYANRVTALFGPSGCGKSTLIRVFNRIYECS